MLRTLAVLVASLLCASCSAAPQVGADVEDIAERGGDGVWQVESTGCGWRSRGSAFAIDARHLVTNHHVIANDSSPVVRSRDGKERIGKVIGATRHPDIAVIEVADDLPAHMRWAPTSSLVQREPLVVIGYPSPAFDFKASTGQIVEFRDGDESREAAVVNAPVARGNSGGPGLRADTSVAGVVTQMAVRDRPDERVAILFTADAVRPAVTKFLREPTKVLSSCGLGPDYIPPVPERYEITQAPPTARPVRALPVATEPPQRPSAGSAPRAHDPVDTPARVTPLACPEGGITLEIRELRTPADPDNAGWWKVEAYGLIRNDSRARTAIHRIDVTVPGDPPVTGEGRGYTETLEPQQRTEWVFDDKHVYSPEGPPTRVDAVVAWEWLDSRDWRAASDCPSGDVAGSGPATAP